MAALRAHIASKIVGQHSNRFKRWSRDETFKPTRSAKHHNKQTYKKLRSTKMEWAQSASTEKVFLEKKNWPKSMYLWHKVLLTVEACFFHHTLANPTIPTLKFSEHNKPEEDIGQKCLIFTFFVLPKKQTLWQTFWWQLHVDVNQCDVMENDQTNEPNGSFFWVFF